MVGKLPISLLAPSCLPEMPEIASIGIFAGACSIKKNGALDVLLLTLPPNTSVAGVFTKSKTRSAAIDWCKNSLKSKTARAFLCNSGNSNAFTGRLGEEAVKKCAESLNLPLNQVFIASTGVIGVPLPYENITQNIKKLKPSSWLEAAQAISTTDTFYKLSTVKLGDVVINGIAKGSGMIAPDMATMISVIVTNAQITSEQLQEMLTEINEKTFNSITVDSDTSTSDTLLVFATNQYNISLSAFKAKLYEVVKDLALQVVKDGEGATKFITIKIEGAENNQAAKKVGMSIANSPPVKTAIAGEDANWGRIVAAIGKSGQEASRDNLTIKIGGIILAQNGQVANFNEEDVTKHIKGKNIEIYANVGIGNGAAEVYTCDLTHQYISINADYRS